MARDNLFKKNIRICRGDKGTLFVLLKIQNSNLFDKFVEFNSNFG